MDTLRMANRCGNGRDSASFASKETETNISMRNGSLTTVGFAVWTSLFAQSSIPRHCRDLTGLNVSTYRTFRTWRRSASPKR